MTRQPNQSTTILPFQNDQLAKWKNDETLGDQATIAMILYANQNCTFLKPAYPKWKDRILAIAKIWKSLSNEERQPYVKKARENRYESRKKSKCQNPMYLTGMV